MDIQKEIEKHEKAIELLDAIEHFRNKKRCKLEDVDSKQGSLLPSLKKKWLEHAGMYEILINKLIKRYNKL